MNGKIGDNPISDILIHNLHPLPLDMEKMIREINSINPQILHDNFSLEPFDWEQGKDLEEGRKKLKELLSKYKND